MSSATYVGRVGALAVALGIGTAVAGTPWIGVAEPSAEASSESSESSESSATQSTSTDDASPATSVDTSGDTDTASDASTESTDEGTETAETPEGSADQENTPDHDVATATSTPEPPRVSPTGSPEAAGSSDDDDAVVSTPVATVDESEDAAVTASVDDDEADPKPVTTAAAVESAPATTVELSMVQTTVVENPPLSAPVGEQAAPTAVTALVSGLLAWAGMGPSLAPGPVTPAQPPLLWGLLAFARREIAGAPVNLGSIVGNDPAGNSQSFGGVTTGGLKAAPVIAVPAVHSNVVALPGVPVFRALRAVVSDVISRVLGMVARVSEAFQQAFINRTPTTAWRPAENSEPVDGVVTGDLNAVDADGDPLSFTLVETPQRGTLKLHPDGTFTYTQSREFAATGGTDVFTVKVNDGGGHFHGLRAFFQQDSGHSTTATVTIFDPQVIDTINVGDGPTGVAVSPDGDYVYVSNRQDGTVSVIDTGSDSVAATIPVGDDPLEVAVSPDGDHVYVTSLLDGAVSVIDTETDSVTTIAVGNGPRGVAVSPDGDTAYVTNLGDGTVSVIDTASNTVTSTIAVGDGPGLVAVSPDGDTAYVANLGDETVSVIDTETNSVTKTIAVGELPAGVAVSPDGDRVYVANSDGTMSVIDTETNTVTATIAVGGGPRGVAVSPNGTRAYVTNDAVTIDGDTVTVIDTETNTVIATIAVGGGPRGVAVSPDGTRLYVANAQGTVTVISV